MFTFYQQLMGQIDIFQLQESSNSITLKSNCNFWNRPFFERVYLPSDGKCNLRPDNRNVKF